MNENLAGKNNAENDVPLPEIQSWYREAAARWPEVFPKAQLSVLWREAQEIVKGGGETLKNPAGRREFHHLLKLALLQLLRKAVNECTACELHVHRLKNRAVLEDGDPSGLPLFATATRPAITAPVDTSLMLLGSHPGPLEGRTALPFTSATVLAGSLCGSLCGQYERCYPKGATTPQAPCEPVWLPVTPPESAAPIAAERAVDPGAAGDPGANYLDQALLEAGEWRAAWNPRQSRRKTKPENAPRPGTVYLTDLVKCPTGGPDPSEAGRSAKPAEVKACHRWLEMQVYILQPRAILALGSAAAEALVTLKESAARPVSVFHPRWIARQPKEKRPAEIQKLVVAIQEARAAAIAGPLPVETETLPDAVDPLAPRTAAFVPTFPDEALEAAVKGELTKGPPAG